MTQLPQPTRPVVSPTTGQALPGFTVGTRHEDPFGHVVERPGQDEWDQGKELRSKIAWVLGTVYKLKYGGGKDPIRIYALLIATAILRDHGYPN